MATAARTLPWGYGARGIKLGDGRNDLGIQAGGEADIDFQQAAKKANYQNQHKFISNYNTTSALLIFQQYRHTGILMRSCVFE